MHLSKSNIHSSTQGNLLGLLTAAFYGLFTLLPDSNTAMVEWSWVLFWQVGLLCPVLWFLGLFWQGRMRWLGNRWDWLVGVVLVVLLLALVLAPFKMAAGWYGWAIACFLAALYALNSWLATPQRRAWVLTAQGYLSYVFILVSLLLWTSQTLLPELSRLQEFRQYGVNLSFDFSRIELRNGSPIGHQNYVAGYLVLTLPLLLGLGLGRRGWQRWFWLVGVGLGLFDLYTTGSRGGWFGVAVLGVIGLAALLWGSALPRRWVGVISLGGLALLVTLAIANNRLRSLFTGITTGAAGGELAYRLITITTGWHMGLSHWLTGGGPGSVLPLYQKYRPVWAGREAELHYQLHSTPAQLWAELGIGSMVIGLGAIALLSDRSIRWWRLYPAHRRSIQMPSHLVGYLLAALLAYLIVSLTDYQLDNLCISGVITIYVAVLAAEFRGSGEAESGETSEAPDRNPGIQMLQSRLPLLSLIGLASLVAMILWLVPIHRAWMVSNQGFAALSRKDMDGFVQRLTQAHQLAPWDAYYPFQLGWNLGNLGLQAQVPDHRQALMTEGADWLKRGIQAAPNQEFGYSNLAWLLLNRNPREASQAFAQATQLVPAKRGGFYGLGLSLIAQGKSELAQAALILEVMRDPQFITSPIWRLPELQPLYGAIASQVESRYTALLANAPSGSTFANQLHQFRGGLRWWLGDLQGARTDLETNGTPASRLVLDLATGKNIQAALPQAPLDASTLAIAAWVNLSQRQNLLQQAWITANHELPPPEMLQQLVETMNRSASFDQWLKQNAPTAQRRRARVGFGILNRHADGPIPVDFMTVIDNIPMTTFFDTALLPSITFTPELDTALQTERHQLLQKVLRNL